MLYRVSYSMKTDSFISKPNRDNKVLASSTRLALLVGHPTEVLILNQRHSDFHELKNNKTV